MNYKSHATRKSTPSRMARKHNRRDVFVFNKKMAKARRKAARLLRRQREQDEE